MAKRFFGQVLEAVLPTHTAVELGAGDGWTASRLASNGAKVIAVDKKTKPEGLPSDVEWHEEGIDAWLAGLAKDFKADAFVLKNGIKFLEKPWVTETLLPEVVARTNSGGIVAIETYRQEPAPSYRGIKSLFDVTELKAAFPGWEILREEEATEHTTETAKTKRAFFLSRLIARKP